MKTLKIAAFALLFSVVFTQVQAEPLNLNPQEELEQQISKMIADSDAWGTIDQDVVFKVSFTINAQGEVIVLSTDNTSYDQLIKNLLNYRKVDVEAEFYNKIYFLPIRLNK